MRAAVLLLAPTLAGCPSAVNPPDNNNDNSPPDEVQVTIIGQGDVTQTADNGLVILLAVPDDGWEFDRWGNADIANVLENPITVDVDDVPSISCTFTPQDADDDGVTDASDDCPNTPADEAAEVNTAGCGPSERDTDGDGVNDNVDRCERTPAGITIDEEGCPVGDPTTGDDDGDGVSNDIDQCPNTPADTVVDPNGCAAAQRDSDDDGITDDRDRCGGTPPGTVVDSTGCPIGNEPPPTCGNNSLDSGEVCDGTADVACPGLCLANCTCASGAPANDNCANARTVTQGTHTFNNLGATTDGVAHPGLCTFFNYDHIESDVWFRFVADCTGPAVASLCGTEYDTKVAVYQAETCPPGNPVACSDDDCGSGFTSRAAFGAVAGQTYLIRVGGFEGEQGEGQLTVLCNVDSCDGAAGDCFAEHADRGCSDATCCGTTCDADPYCCDVEWDDICASEAAGLCTGNFSACAAGAGSCGAENGSPGCEDVECCNAVCADDPFCCVDTWDNLCAENARGTCLLTCGGQAGSCFTARTTPGCGDIDCCETICTADAFCCSVEWDQECADAAATQCR